MNMQNRNNDNRLGHRKSRRWSARSMIVGTAALAATLASTVPAVATTAHKATHGSVSAPFYTATTSKSFSSATASLKTAVSSAGMMVLGQLNQAGALSITGLHLKGAETFFVGNPTSGKKFFQMDAAIGAVIPMRIYLWVNAAGQTEIGYLQPSSLAKAVDSKFAKSATMLDGAASMIAKSVTGKAPHVSATVHNLVFVKTSSTKSFSSATASLKTAVSSAGMMVLGQLNQAGALSITGLHLNGAASYFVGNPTTGKSLFEMNSAIGIEIPLDIYLWVNAAGKTQIGYFKPAEVMTAISGKFASSSSMFDKTAASIVRATK
jgi:uncharacterized protein (DUF302 family)